MFWDLIEERIKGFAYATEPQRLLLVAEDQVIFDGGSESHILLRVRGAWTCDCAAYSTLCSLPGGGWCRHTIALERIRAALAAGAFLPVRHAVVMHGGRTQPESGVRKEGHDADQQHLCHKCAGQAGHRGDRRWFADGAGLCWY